MPSEQNALSQLSTSIHSNDAANVRRVLASNPHLDLNAPLPDTAFV